MGWTEALQGAPMAMFFNRLNRWEWAELSQEEAAEWLGVRERTFRRWTRRSGRRSEEEGEAGLVDRRLGRASGRRVPADRGEEVERLDRARYPGFTAKPFPEPLIKEPGFGWSSTWTKPPLQWAGVVPKAPRKGAHRRKRERRPLGDEAASEPAPAKAGDGSRHEGLEGQPALDRIVAMDDATGAISSAFSSRRGAASTFRGSRRRSRR